MLFRSDAAQAAFAYILLIFRILLFQLVRLCCSWLNCQSHCRFPLQNRLSVVADALFSDETRTGCQASKRIFSLYLLSYFEYFLSNFCENYITYFLCIYLFPCTIILICILLFCRFYNVIAKNSP